MKPMAVTESPSTFWLSSLTAMYQMTDTTPIAIVDTVGVWKRGLTLPNDFGSAPSAPSTGSCAPWAGSSSAWSRGGAEHGDDEQLVQRRAEDLVAQHAEDVVGVVGQELLAAVGLRREGDDHVDEHEQDRAHHGGSPRAGVAIL